MTMINPKQKFPKPGKKEKPQDYPGLEASMVTKPVYDSSEIIGTERLGGKVAVVTGGDSGIGRAVAVAFAKEGADIVIAHLPEEKIDADETIRVIEELGGTAISVPGDLNSDKYCQQLIETTIKKFGRIDILVNNAAYQKFALSIEEMTSKDFALIYKVNVIAPFLLSQSALKYMEPGSSIINTVSIQAYEPSSLLLPYAASKSALVALTKGLSEELLEKGIRVNAVAPGPIWSPLNTHGAPEEKLKKFGENSPLSRPGQPIELAPIFVLLASDQASYITGEIFGVTGGRSIA